MTITTESGASFTLESINDKLRAQGVLLVLEVEKGGALHNAYTTAEVEKFEPSTYRPKSQIDR